MSAFVISPPPPAPVLSPGTRPNACTFPGRSFADYVGAFALDPAALRGKDVLDVAAGASSFVAEACGRKIHAVAVDPLYGCNATELAGRLQGTDAPVAAHHHTRDHERLIAAERFLADFQGNFIDNRYVAGALPQLPFLDGTFDLVLCRGLLFVEAPGLEAEWNLAACREMVRVSADGVRIFPVYDRAGRAFPGLVRLRRELKEAGIASSVRSSSSVGAVAGTSWLELRRAAP